jgi:trk system potassium uptake protein TrkA
MKIIIIGCGRVGAGLARNLSERGHAVIAVDKDPSAFDGLGSTFKGQTVTGVGFDRDVLLRAGIERADGLAAVTKSDEVNAVTARLARQFFCVPQVVARLHEPRKAEIYRRLGIQTISPVAWGINRIAELVCHSRLDTILSLGDGEVDVVEAEIPPLLVGRTVHELTVPSELAVLAITRGGKSFIPTLGTTFQAGDLVHLSVLATAADRLKKLLGM